MASLQILCLAASAEATIVRFHTTLGTIDARMYDTATPQSVANFLNYVVDDDYDGSFFHRAPKTFRVDSQGNQVLDEFGNPIVDTFVVQGGGFVYADPDGDESYNVFPVPTDPPVVNEPGISNLPGTIAYAKQGGNPNSATSGFFFNTTNNVNNLDSQNGGFTVFARVVAGQETLDAITQLPIFDLDGAGMTFDTVPLLNVPAGLEENFIFLTDVEILNLPPGDYDFDGDVDLDDYAVLTSTVGSTTEAAADGNGDGVVNAADFAIWRDSLPPNSVAVPEPATCPMVILAAAASRRRKLRSAQNAGLG